MSLAGKSCLRDRCSVEDEGCGIECAVSVRWEIEEVEGCVVGEV